LDAGRGEWGEERLKRLQMKPIIGKYGVACGGGYREM